MYINKHWESEAPLIDVKLPEIQERLFQFKNLPVELWAREVMLCLLTPQTNPIRAERALCELEYQGLFEMKLSEIKVAEILRKPQNYVRFHNVKAKRIVLFLNQLKSLMKILTSKMNPQGERDQIYNLINGFGLKESSRALRNIGRQGLAILDRHILKKLI